MALTSWKAFNFFDVSQVKPPDDVESPAVFDNDLSCICTGSNNIFLGSNDGYVRILSQAFKVIRSFKAHETGSITHMKQVEGTALLVTIAEDLSNEPVLKVWALDKTEKKTGIPRCQSTLTIQNGRRQFPISAFAALEDLSQLAVGFANGSVTVIRGDLIHDRGAKQRTVFESQEPITGVEFRVGSTTTLYLATTGRILTLTISGKGQGQPARALEDSGCGLGCMTVDRRNGDIVVVRDDAIYYYGENGRGPCFAFEGPKKLVSAFKEYLALVSPPRATSTSKANAVRRFGGAQADEFYNTSTFTLLDTDLKYVAHSEALISQVKALFVEWGDIFLLTLDGKLFRYHEKSLQQKLEILYQRNLYVLAINLAQKAGVDIAQQNVIYRKYGDYLYQKGDYDTAMQQYLRAIDNTEPSQVIRKFLDTQRIHNLIQYLEELHEHRKNTADHTTLLLNCYAKLKDIDKLEKFIKAPGEPNFDVDTAITMCRQGGYYEQAAYLATKHGEHELVVDILIEDSKTYDAALRYIWRLDPLAAYPNLMKYARVLLEHCPQDTTRLFIDYYTGQYRPKKEPPVSNDPTPQSGAVSAVQNLASYLPYINTASITSPGSAGNQKATISEAQLAETQDAQPPPEYDIPRPRTAFSSFVDHPDEFIVFLEACLKEDDLEEGDKIDLYTTMFEMYLDKANDNKGNEKEQWEVKAKALIEGKNIPIDTSNVLLLSHLSNFRDGTILVREQQGLRFDIFRSYTSANDTVGAIKALRKYGPEEPQLYPAALAYFTSSPRILEEAGDELSTVLKRIDEDHLMAPLQVIETLSTNAVATMGMVKKYLSDTIERERSEISYNRRLIESYRSETATKRHELDDLATNPAVFNPKRCSACGGNLDLPTVHFMCKHSFHQRCLNDVDGKTECPICAPQNSTIRAMRKAQEETANRHDMFQDALQRSQDRFGTIKLLAREIHIAQQSLTEPSPENGRALYEPRSTEADRHSMSPELPRNKRRKTTTAIVENASNASEAKRRKSTNIYGSKGSSQADFEIHGSLVEKRQASKEGEKSGHDLWQFPGSSASDDPLAPRRETGSTRVKSRNAGGHTINVESSRKPDQRQLNSTKESFEPHDVLSHDGKSPQSAKSHGTAPLAGTSFKIDLTDPTLVLTASQKEQYQQLSTTTSTAGSLPSPLPDEPSFINPYGKFSDASSTIPNSTPSKQVQAGGVEISPFPETRTSPDVSVISIAMQTPRQASQQGSKSSHTPRRSKSTLGLESPDDNKSTSFTSKKKADMSIPTQKTKRRSKTTTSVSSQYLAEEVALGDSLLAATVLDVPNTTTPKTTKKRKAKDVDELGSDDIAIGLPKEQYKPRPSRSRGNTNLEGLLESVDFSKRPEAQIKAKNKRRKTHEPDVPEPTDGAALIQADKPTAEEAMEQTVGTITAVANPSDTVTILDEESLEKVNDRTNPPEELNSMKRKLPTDDTTEHDANASNAHPQTEPKAPTHATPKQPAAKPRGRPRKKTEEKPPPIPITDEPLREIPIHNDPPPDQKIESQHNEKNNPNPNPALTSALEETSPNSNSPPSDVRAQRPSTPPPHGTTMSSLPATPSQKTTDPQKGQGAQKHSPLNSGRVPYRVGLSKRARIEPLLRGLRK